jgi:hypothetical protein
MLLYPSIFILLKEIYMEISEEKLLDVLEKSKEKFWYLGILSTVTKQDLDDDPELEKTVIEKIEKYSNEIEYIRKYKNFSYPYYWGLYVGMEFCIQLINEGEKIGSQSNGRVGFPVL